MYGSSAAAISSGVPTKQILWSCKSATFVAMRKTERMSCDTTMLVARNSRWSFCVGSSSVRPIQAISCSIRSQAAAQRAWPRSNLSMRVTRLPLRQSSRAVADPTTPPPTTTTSVALEEDKELAADPGPLFHQGVLSLAQSLDEFLTIAKEFGDALVQVASDLVDGQEE